MTQNILTGERNLSDYFETAIKAYQGDAKRVSNWLMNDVLRMLNESRQTADQLKLTPHYLAEIIKLVDANTINTSTGKTLVEKVEQTGRRRRKSWRTRTWPRCVMTTRSARCVRRCLRRARMKLPATKPAKSR